MKYEILWSGSITELQDKVDAALKRGWQLQGGVAVILKDARNALYYQAVTKALEPEVERC